MLTATPSSAQATVVARAATPADDPVAGHQRGRRRRWSLFGLLMHVVKRYKRCPSNRVLVIYGKTGGGNAAKCVHGGAAFVFPLIQDYAYLSLEPIQIEIPLKGALSIENIRVNVPERLHRRHRHRPGDDAERGHPPPRPRHRRDQAAGRRHHLRPAPAGDRVDADRGHQPRPRQVPARASRTRSSRS